MVNNISSFDPTAYLNHVKGIKTSSTGDSNNTSGTTTTTTSSGTTDLNSTAKTLGVAQDIITLLDSTSSDSSNGDNLSGILGGNSSDNFLSGVYSTLLQQKSQTQPLLTAIAAQEQKTATPTSPVTDLIASRHAGLNAYNKTLQQNAQSVIDSIKLIT